MKNYRKALDASLNLFNELKRMSNDLEVLRALDIPDFGKGKGQSHSGIDNRLGLLCLSELFGCFEILGHKYNPKKEESNILSLFLTLYIAKEEQILYQNEDNLKIFLNKGIIEEFYTNVRSSITTPSKLSEFRLVGLLHFSSVSDEKISLYATKLYRLCQIIAEEDNTITQEEKDWLNNILFMSSEIHRQRIFGKLEEGRTIESFPRAVEAAKKLHSLLKEMSKDNEILYALSKVTKYDYLYTYEDGDFTSIFNGIDLKLGILCLSEIIGSFEKLGHSLNYDNDESWILSIFLSLIYSKGNDLIESEKTLQKKEVFSYIESLYKLTKQLVNYNGEVEDFVFVKILRNSFVDEEKVNKYVILLYRYLLIIAEADDKVTVQEKEWLTQIMKFSSENYNKPKEVETDHPIESIFSPLQELKDLIGLENVKKEVENIYSLVKVQKFRESKGMKFTNVSYHCVFTGNPGTGKTTVARILAGIYKDLGVLKKGHLIETDRSGLIAEYLGQTAVKTNKIIDSALDGVLFIDEAYSLIQGHNNDYGNEAISTLLKRMEDDRNRLVVILAGYSKEMEGFINSNPGLESRFNRYIKFEDYTAEELYEIFISLLKKYEYHLEEKASECLKLIIQKEIANKTKNFGNARFIRNLFEKTLENQAMRIVRINALNEETVTQIIVDDIPK